MRRRPKRRSADAAAPSVLLLGVLAVAVTVFAAVYTVEGNSGPLHTVRLGAAEALRPLSGGLPALARPFEALRDQADVAFSAEDERLRRELVERQAAAAKASDLTRENALLRGMLETARPVYEYGPLARVIAPIGSQSSGRVVIDVGTEDGIEDNQPVVVGENTLVGRTTNVSRNTAQVMLVGDRLFAAGVRIVPPAEFDPASETIPPAITAERFPYGQGMIGSDPEGYFGVDYVDRGLRAEEGDYVVTSGKAEGRDLLEPPGLYVGTVESSTTQDIDQFKKIVVDPAMDLRDLDHVRIITDWQR